MVEKILYTVAVTLKCDASVTFADTEDKAVGTAAYQQIGHDIRIIDGTKEIYIPYDAICKIEVTKTTTQVEYKDELCVEA